MNHNAIRIEHVSKEYRLGAYGSGTLKGDIQSWFARVRGLEDPNKKIGDTRIGDANARFLALNDLNLEIPEGQALGIIGHNGAGKSTLLKLLARVTAPTSGRITYTGRVSSMLEVGTGFHQELTGRENIYMNGAILGMTKAEIDSKFDEIVAFSEVERFIDTPVKRYSSGMYVKLAFSVAAHLNSEIMIMDEVLAVGDAAFQHKCIEKMRSEATVNGKTVLYVSHNMSTIRQLCERCVVLDHGSLVFDGDVEGGIQRYIGLSDFVFAQHYGLLANKRPKTVVGGKIQLVSVDLLNTEDNIFCEGDKIKIRLTFQSEIESDRLELMMIFFARDDTKMGMSESNYFSCKKGENVIEAEIPLDCFINEEYKVQISITDFQNDGISLRQDCANDAFYFKVHTPECGKISDVWRSSTWGRLRGKEIQVF